MHSASRVRKTKHIEFLSIANRFSTSFSIGLYMQDLQVSMCIAVTNFTTLFNTQTHDRQLLTNDTICSASWAIKLQTSG